MGVVALEGGDAVAKNRLPRKRPSLDCDGCNDGSFKSKRGVSIHKRFHRGFRRRRESGLNLASSTTDKGE